MPAIRANGVNLYYELMGSGEPLVLVHGSWADATTWQLVVPELSEHFRLLTYDRRGHSRSEGSDEQGSVDEDSDDLAALVEDLDLAPAHVAGISYGGSIALRLAIRRSNLVRSLSCHEPPLFDLVGDDPDCQEAMRQTAPAVAAVGQRIAHGDHEGAARQFVDEMMSGPGAWDEAMPPEVRALMVRNASTFLDELQDLERGAIDRQAAARLQVPVQLTYDPVSPLMMRRVVERLAEIIPGSLRVAIEGATHVPSLAAPQQYVQVLLGWASSAAAAERHYRG